MKSGNWVRTKSIHSGREHNEHGFGSWNRKRRMRITLRIGLLLMLIGILSGCSLEPVPLTIEEHHNRVETDRQHLYTDQEPLTKPLTLSMAIARALKYNFDHRLSMMEAVLQDEQNALTRLDMLPKLIANAGYSWRDDKLASYSVPVEESSDREAYYTTSQDREKDIAGLTFSWNVLDFGMSYYEAKQQSDRFLIAHERRRRVINNIIRQVCDAYYHAITAERLMEPVKTTLADAQHALEMNHQIEKERLKPLIDVLQYRKDLLKIIDKLNQLYHNLEISKTRLAALINLPLNEDYTIYFPEEPEFDPPLIRQSIGDLEVLGLYFRHDIREEVYKARIDQYQVKKEMISLFPGLTFSASANHDSNSFLMNNNWAELGIDTSMKLFELVKGPKRLKVAKTKILLDDTRRLAMTVASLVQIHIAHQKYQQSIESYDMNNRLLDVETRLQKAVSNVTRLKAGSDLENIRQNAATIASVMNRDFTYATAMSALFELYTSLGIDFYGGPVGDIELAALTDQIERRLTDWQAARIPSIPEMPQETETDELSKAQDLAQND